MIVFGLFVVSRIIDMLEVSDFCSTVISMAIIASYRIYQAYVEMSTPNIVCDGESGEKVQQII